MHLKTYITVYGVVTCVMVVIPCLPMGTGGKKIMYPNTTLPFFCVLWSTPNKLRLKYPVKQRHNIVFLVDLIRVQCIGN